MFRAIASLLLFGTLSPLSFSPMKEPSAAVARIDIAPPPIVSRLQVGSGLSASGAIVIDVLNGTEIFGINADQPRAFGSLAKLMTALIILENHELDEIVTIPRSVEGVEGNKVGLRPGDRYTIYDLLQASLIASANDAAHTLAIEHSDSIALFAEDMNARARALGLTQTRFQNPIGFDNLDQFSTPRDLAWLSMYVLKNDIIRTMTSQRGAKITDTSGGTEIVLYNTNKLLTSHPTQFFGLKTGTTYAAGESLIALTYFRGRPYLFVVLNSNDRYEDTLQLFAFLLQANA